MSFLCILEYPHELVDLHKDYQLAPERLQIEENILSDYQRHLLLDEGFSKPPPKLVPNLCNKTNFIIHYRNLKFYLDSSKDCLSPTSIVFCCSINSHGWKTTSTSTLVNVMKNNLWIFTLQECLTALNIGSLCFSGGLKSQKKFHDRSTISILMLC